MKPVSEILCDRNTLMTVYTQAYMRAINFIYSEVRHNFLVRLHSHDTIATKWQNIVKRMQYSKMSSVDVRDTSKIFKDSGTKIKKKKKRILIKISQQLNWNKEEIFCAFL